MLGLLPLSMIEPRARGCVEQTVSANLCVLSPRSLDKMSQEVLQKARPVRASEVEIDDPRLPEIQTTEHAEHVKIALSYRRKEYSRRKADQRSEGSSKELTELIDANARAIAANVKAAMSINARKRKALNAECPVSKRRRVTLGKSPQQLTQDIGHIQDISAQIPRLLKSNLSP
ncbi:hypothetical protein PCASD_03058 [Puccinia coronata f. sp. avenae]|uniref:Uncharacterized protein n=1 Tax=Puccinia coronata f. sp. avenae TaxID=200324 RepID=A0A2N5VGJ9_9BASI|nr:hypothetical protein PCASD_03058 [Puccinia coronata f. sp. avenae]